MSEMSTDFQMFLPSRYQVPVDSVPNTDEGVPVCVPVPMYAFCRQISGAEFEQQKLASSQKAMEELLEILLTDQNMSEKDRRKKLKQVTCTSQMHSQKLILLCST